MPDEVSQAVFRVLAACRSIELAVSGLYEELASLHRGDPELSRLWKKTAHEETNHAAQFSLLMETMLGSISATRVDPSTLDRVRASVENTIEEYRLHPPSPRDALGAAIDFEEAMRALHADKILVFADPRCKRLMRAMMAADHGHISALRAALSKQG